MDEVLWKTIVQILPHLPLLCKIFILLELGLDQISRCTKKCAKLPDV